MGEMKNEVSRMRGRAWGEGAQQGFGVYSQGVGGHRSTMQGEWQTSSWRQLRCWRSLDSEVEKACFPFWPLAVNPKSLSVICGMDGKTSDFSKRFRFVETAFT